MTSIHPPFIHGFFLSLAMIVAIGAQNAFVMKPAMKGRHVMTVALVCALCDASLILLGSLGVGTFIASNKLLELGMSLVGCLFLVFYAASSLKQAFRPNEVIWMKIKTSAVMKANHGIVLS